MKMPRRHVSGSRLGSLGLPLPTLEWLMNEALLERREVSALLREIKKDFIKRMIYCQYKFKIN